MTYDSRPDTHEHIDTVRVFLHVFVVDILQRALVHDASKLVEPEVAVFDEFTPKLKASTFGSEEYEGFRAAMGEGLRHHYAANDHHPEHHPNGFADMSLFEVIEMFADWCAATQRHDDGDIRKSIEINAERFGYGPEIVRLLTNTVDKLEATIGVRING